MYKKITTAVIATVSMATYAQDLPPATDFYQCVHFYRWIHANLKEPTPMKNHVTSSLNLFELGAVMLSGGVDSKVDSESAGVLFKAAVKKATDENQTVADLFKTMDTKCWDMQRRHTMAILKKSTEIGARQKPYFTHAMPPGLVSVEDIARRQEFIKSQEGVSADDQNGMIIYSLSRKIGANRETVHHAFTKEGHPAHPAVVFLSSRLDGTGKPPVQSNTGSYAGAKPEFDGLYMAFTMMNQGR